MQNINQSYKSNIKSRKKDEPIIPTDPIKLFNYQIKENVNAYFTEYIWNTLIENRIYTINMIYWWIQSILMNNVYLVYKGGNTINDYIYKLYLNVKNQSEFEKNIIDLSTFSDIDFSIVFNKGALNNDIEKTANDIYNHFDTYAPMFISYLAHMNNKINNTIQTVQKNVENIISDIFFDKFKNIYNVKLDFLCFGGKIYHGNINILQNKIYNFKHPIDNNNKNIWKKLSYFSYKQIISYYDRSLCDKNFDNLPNTFFIKNFLEENLQNSGIEFPSYILWYNETTKFKTYNVESNFILVRIKIPFIVVVWINNEFYGYVFKGEYIDVSIPRLHDTNFQNDITKFISVNDLYYPSLNYLIHDLQSILFLQRECPWDDKKYKKRLYRLCLLLFIKIVDTLEIKNDKIDYTLSIQKYENKYKEKLNLEININNDLSFFTILIQGFIMKTINAVCVNKNEINDMLENTTYFLQQIIKLYDFTKKLDINTFVGTKFGGKLYTIKNI